MPGENGPSKEALKVVLTKEQFDEISNVYLPDLSDIELHNFTTKIEKMGIALDSGIITIVVDGETIKISTSEGDFGTVVSDPDAETIRSGF